MKKYIVLTFVIIVSFFMFGCSNKDKNLNDLETIKDRGYVIIGVKSDSPPFGFYNDENTLVGLDVDIAYEISSHIFKDTSRGHVKLVPVNAQNRISKLNSGEVDLLVATMSVNEKRKLVMQFSQPYFAANQKLLIRKTSKIKHLQHFNKDGRLAVIMGTTGEKVARSIAPNANLIGAQSYIEAYEMLIRQDVDAVLGDDCILSGFKDNSLKILNRAYSREFYAVALRKSDKSKELLNRVNLAIATILDEKKIRNITKKWILY